MARRGTGVKCVARAADVWAGGQGQRTPGQDEMGGPAASFPSSPSQKQAGYRMIATAVAFAVVLVCHAGATRSEDPAQWYQGYAASGPDTVALWHLDGGEGQVVEDAAVGHKQNVVPSF